MSNRPLLPRCALWHSVRSCPARARFERKIGAQTYCCFMVTVWLGSVRRSLHDALDLMAAAVNECPDHLWESSMWWVDVTEIVGEARDARGNPVNDPELRSALVQRWSAPWSVAWHALEVLDYDLAGELQAWEPPAPFAGNPHWLTFTSRPAWTKAEIATYVDHCRRRVNETFVDMTAEKAASSLPAVHRNGGQPYARIVTSLIGHTTAHAMQIRQFGASVVRPDRSG